MSNPLSEFLREQYTEFAQDVERLWGIDRVFLSSIAPQVKPLHKRYLSLACAATVAGHRAPRSEYAFGIGEAAQLAIVLNVKGLENPACVLLRQTIELCLKHIYFSTHPVEYAWAASRVDLRDLTFQYLLEYLRRTDEYRSLSQTKDCGKVLNEWFGILSRHVHVLSRSFMGYRRVIGGVTPKRIDLALLEGATRNLWPQLIVLLIAFSPHRFARASAIEKKLIRAALAPSGRRTVDLYLRELQPLRKRRSRS